MPGVISSIGKPIFEKSRVKWSVGFALGFLATLCGGVCVTAISWAQPKPSCRCGRCRQPASLASLEGRAPCGTHGAAPPLGPGPAGFGFSPVQTRDTVSSGCSSPYPPPTLSVPCTASCPRTLPPAARRRRCFPLPSRGGRAGSPGTAPVAVGGSRWAAVLGLLAVGAGVVLSHAVCVCACARTRTHARTHAHTHLHFCVRVWGRGARCLFPGTSRGVGHICASSARAPIAGQPGRAPGPGNPDTGPRRPG